MPKPCRLTRQAERSLVEIARWTLETFGPRQAEAYEADLIARCTAIAAGDAPSQDCRRLIDPDLPEDLRFTRAGQHFIVFVDMPGKVIVVDVLHSRSDLPRRLAALGPAKIPKNTDGDQLRGVSPRRRHPGRGVNRSPHSRGCGGYPADRERLPRALQTGHSTCWGPPMD